MTTLSEMLSKVDTELAENTADRDAHDDVSIALLVEYGKLPIEALEWIKRKDASV